MTLPRLYAINDRWERVPPLSVSTAALARWAGALGPSRPHGNSEAAANDDFGALMQMAGEEGSPLPFGVPSIGAVSGELTEAEREKFAQIRARVAGRG